MVQARLFFAFDAQLLKRGFIALPQWPVAIHTPCGFFQFERGLKDGIRKGARMVGLFPGAEHIGVAHRAFFTRHDAGIGNIRVTGDKPWRDRVHTLGEFGSVGAGEGITHRVMATDTITG